MTPSEATRETYASDRARGRVGGVVMALPSGLLGSVVTDGVSRGEVPVLALAPVLGALGVRRALAMRVVADDDGLVVHNLFRTYRVGWDEIERFERRIAHLVCSWGRDTVCAVAVKTDGRRVTLLAMPVERRRQKQWRRTKAAAIVDAWERAIARSV